MITHKRGDTFAYSGTLPTDVDFTGVMAASQIRTSSRKLVAALEVRIDAGRITLRAHPTHEWPVDSRAALDIQFTFPSGDIISTTTEYVQIVADITQP